MFSTMAYSNGCMWDETSTSELIQDRPKKRIACLECRSRKVKCTGERLGCQKCVENKISCIYPTNSSNSRTDAKPKRGENLSSANRSNNKDINREPNRKAGSVDSGSGCSSVSSVHDYSMLSCPTPVPSEASTLHFGPNDMVFQNMPLSLPLVDDISLDVDDLGLSHLGKLGDYADPSPDGFKPTSTIDGGLSRTNSMDDCSCAQCAVQMLASLDAKMTHHIANLSIDAILADQEQSLSQINSWLSCRQCVSPRATTKMIALIADGLCSCLEKAVADYAGQLQEGVAVIGDEEVGGGSQASPIPTGGSCNIGEYQVSSWREWAHILRVSLLCRCRELQAVVASLQGREVLCGLMQEAAQKLTKIRNHLKRYERFL